MTLILYALEALKLVHTKFRFYWLIFKQPISVKSIFLKLNHNLVYCELKKKYF
jgi:hypothetical protein